MGELHDKSIRISKTAPKSSSYISRVSRPTRELDSLHSSRRDQRDRQGHVSRNSTCFWDEYIAHLLKPCQSKEAGAICTWM